MVFAFDSVDWNGPLPTGPGDSVVEVVPPDIELDPRIFEELRITIDPLTVCWDYGVEFYVNCVTSSYNLESKECIIM